PQSGPRTRVRERAHGCAGSCESVSCSVPSHHHADSVRVGDHVFGEAKESGDHQRAKARDRLPGPDRARIDLRHHTAHMERHRTKLCHREDRQNDITDITDERYKGKPVSISISRTGLAYEAFDSSQDPRAHQRRKAAVEKLFEGT